jgi:hypothetical protein
MYTHKINSSLSEHQNFLAQNRKDPITGDSISDGDEVVFCAGCKSVFFKDTWEYLGKRHCQQHETLAKFPVQKEIRLKAEDTILFYTSLPYSGKSQTSIPSQAKKNPWIKTSQNISPYQDILHHPFMGVGKVVCFALYIILFSSMGVSTFSIGFITFFALQAVTFLHDWYYGNKIKSTYQYFKNNTFYITKKSIGFASKYGFQEFVLPFQEIEGIIFHEKDNFFSNSYCKVYYKKNGVNQSMKFNVDSGMFNNATVLFSALNSLSSTYSVPIHIESNKENTLYHVEKLIANGNSTIRISTI